MSSRRLEKGAPVDTIRWDQFSDVVEPEFSPEEPPETPPSAPSPEPPSQAGETILALERQVRDLDRHLAGALEQIERERRENYERGNQEGRAHEAAKWREALERVGRALHELAQTRVKFRREIESDAVRLALAIARKVLNREISIDPEALGGLVRVAFEKVNQRELHRVRIHPDDATPVREFLKRAGCPQRVEISPEPGLERGGLILETERGELDASVNSQLAEIERGLVDLLRHE